MIFRAMFWVIFMKCLNLPHHNLDSCFPLFAKKGRVIFGWVYSFFVVPRSEVSPFEVLVLSKLLLFSVSANLTAPCSNVSYDQDNGLSMT